MIKRTIQTFVDISTSADGIQVIGIYAGGNNVKDRLGPFFQAFKHYKLGAVKVLFAPASTLPVDPTGLSLEAGEATVDPRDQFNPGLIRITNGEDMLSSDVINGLTEEQGRQIYNQMMLDPRWYKFQLQSGCKRTARPLYWSIGQIHQDAYPGSVVNAPGITLNPDGSSVMNGTGGEVSTFAAQYSTNYPYGEQNFISSTVGSRYGFYQTGHKERIGWLPTDALIMRRFKNSDTPTSLKYGGFAPVPHMELMKIVLPKAYKTLYYYRVFIEETVYFKDPVNYIYPDGSVYNGLDRFVLPGAGVVLGANDIITTTGSGGFAVRNEGSDI